jgi:hypothetical protein
LPRCIVVMHNTQQTRGANCSFLRYYRIVE